MLRINLLPAYIAERKKTRTAMVLASILWVAVLAGFLGLYFYQKNATDARTEEANQKQAEADAVTKLQSDATAERTKIKPLQEKVDFVKAVQYANIIRQKVYRNAARYTYRKVEYNQMAVQGNTLSVAGFVKNTDDLGRFYLTMFGNPDVTAVSIQGIPSYPNNQQTFDPNNQNSVSPTEAGWFPVQLTATLVKPVVSPTLPASLNAGGAGATGGPGGGYGGSRPPAGYGPPSSAGLQRGSGPRGGASAGAD